MKSKWISFTAQGEFGLVTSLSWLVHRCPYSCHSVCISSGKVPFLKCLYLYSSRDSYHNTLDEKPQQCPQNILCSAHKTVPER